MLVIAGVAGVAGHSLASRKAIWLVGPLADHVPAHKHVAFITCIWMHTASYAAGAIGGIVVTWLTWRKRRRKRPDPGTIAP